MKKRFPLYIMLVSLLAGIPVASCNSDSETDEVIESGDSYSVMVNSFSLAADDSILESLDSVFFSIDLDKAIVYNADSLPKGTRVDSLIVSIGLSSVSKAEISMPGSTGVDTVLDYLTNSTEAVNFSRGSVKLHLVSVNEEVSRDYTIFVNVHTTEPDSLSWGRMAMCKIPTTLSAPQEQKTVAYNGRALCFVRQGTDVTRAESANPYDNDWTVQTVALPENAVLNSITATADALYLIDEADRLYVSSDMGSTWSLTGSSMSHIYGGYGSVLLGVRRNPDGTCVHVTYPATVETAVPAGCPVEGTSQSLTYTSDWSAADMLMVMGGRTAAGELTGDVWAFDGQQWADITIAGVPAAEGMTIVPYFSFTTATDWTVTEYPTLIAFGGVTDKGTATNTVYMSRDRGMNWSKAGDLMQFPPYMQPMAYAQALVFDHTYTASRSGAGNGWTECAPLKIPSWFVLQQPAASRAVAPVTEWQCPYIYLFGGVKDGGVFNDTVWRGVINRLTFKPLQ